VVSLKLPLSYQIDLNLHESEWIAKLLFMALIEPNLIKLW
jgi:hypothetical protein